MFHIVDDGFVGAFALAEAAKDNHQTVFVIHACRVFVAGFDCVPTRLLDAPSEGAEVQTVQWMVLKIFTLLPYGLFVIVSPEKEHLVSEDYRSVVGYRAWPLAHWT